jgi:histidinol phosphatase-like PHP family hydrolase
MLDDPRGLIGTRSVDQQTQLVEALVDLGFRVRVGDDAHEDNAFTKTPLNERHLRRLALSSSAHDWR